MKFLIVNVGSTAVKYSLYHDEELIESEIFSRKENSKLQIKEKDFVLSLGADYFVFRVVHASDFYRPSFLSSDLLELIKESKIFAPLHNSFLIEILDFLILSGFKEKCILIFDSEFHSGFSEPANLYPIDQKLAKKYKIRKYGFHGIALFSVIEELEKKLGKIPENLLALHAGGGVSLTAIKNGVSVDTSMGLTPNSGIMMLTRSGDVDPELVRVLQEKENLLASEASEILNFKSGFYGLTGSKDTKEIIEKAKENIEPYKTAYSLFLYELKKYIFAFAGVLGSVDFISLSGGLAYNNEYFADDLYREIKSLPIRREQIIKVKVNEDKIMLKKAKKLIKQL